MGNFKLDWPGVVAFGVALTAAVLVGIFVDIDAAKVIGGLAGGLLVKVGAVGLGGGQEPEVTVEEERK